ncbi:hypothetical protein ACHAXT_001018 [Thalassiosira profunda]
MALRVGYLRVVDCGDRGPSPSSSALDLDAVKRLAQMEGYALISFSQRSRVISFRKEGATELDYVRINVYWTTGTVGTCIHHPRQGKTQLFRRNVDLATLCEIFKNPRVHTGAGYHRKPQSSQFISAPNCSRKLRVGDRARVRGYADATISSPVISEGMYRGKVLVRYDVGQTYHVNPIELIDPSAIGDDEQCHDLENEVKMQMKKLDEEMQSIQREREALGKILRGFEKERERERKRKEEEEAAKRDAAKRKAEEEAADRLAKQRKLEKEKLDAQRASRGKYIQFLLHDSDFVSKSFDETVVSVACAGTAAILLYENGGSAWTAGLPKLLHNKLNGRQKSLPPATYVSMGSQNRYYVKLRDGKSEWVGCEAMSTVLKESSRTVKTIAFGEYWDSYFVVFTDGYWQCSKIPNGLHGVLEKRKCRPDLDCVSLGPDGEYFLSAKNGRAWWGGMSEKQLALVRKHKNEVKFMDFGDYDAFLFRY